MCQPPTEEELQKIAKQGIRRLGLQTNFCYPCAMIQCTAGMPENNWVLTGCGCCLNGHDLLVR